MNFQIDFSDPRDAAAPRLQRAFGTPRETLVARTADEVRPVLRAVEAAARAGDWCVGGLRYEAAGAFDAALVTHAADGPLAWFAVFDAKAVSAADSAAPQADAPTLAWAPGMARDVFDDALRALHASISDGEFYQVNYTAQQVAQVQPAAGVAGVAGVAPQASDRALFAALRRAQPGGYAARLTLGDERVLSVSPELFFDWRPDAHGAGPLLARPMKGTAPRGATAADDAAQAQALRAAPKERAENVMIVDLLRNDLSRVAEPHSVRVPRLFHTEALPTVWQMTSDVSAQTRAGTTLESVFAALFPCGSITGAPKVQAMRAIHALEPAPRGYYCGALGVVRPAEAGGHTRDGEGEREGEGNGAGGIVATFNVPIRTLVLRGNQAACGIGSGITSGAQPDAEWREWRHKRAFAERASAPFDILETLALEGGHLRHAHDHLVRMAAAAAHFGLPWYPPRAEQCLAALAQAHPTGLWRVRLLLDARGQPRAEAFAMAPTAAPVRLALAARPLPEAHGEFVRHKTTRRAHYAAFEPAAGSSAFDTVLYNEDGEITECTRGNIAMQLADGRWVTPPLACGLLPGIGRAIALREGRVTEAVVHKDDAAQVQAWAFLNSLRGWLPATLVA
ncbi:MAG: bifunctional aminodeoxychorismate synthase component I/aminotransferase [Comamonadaceae bacterium]|nr:MAG: bifunctional aminodeoxychorismate synthase component I/aminotransferase [Comamonadaceae bacterium]